MKKILLSLVILTAFILSVKSYADVTLKKDSQNPPIGRVEVLNVKTGGSGAVTRTGEIGNIDLTNFTGINWTALNALGVAGINWTGANIMGKGINWTDIRAYGTSFGGDHSGINWQAFGV